MRPRRATGSTLYGAAGYAIVGDATSLPAYATLTPTARDTASGPPRRPNARALRRAVAPGASRRRGIRRHAVRYQYRHLPTASRIQLRSTVWTTTGAAAASAWTSSMRRPTRCSTAGRSSNLSGGQVRSLDRHRQRPHPRDPAAVAKNAVVSGVFFGGTSPGNQAPTVAITGPAPGATFTLGASDPDRRQCRRRRRHDRKCRVLRRRPVAAHGHDQPVLLQLADGDNRVRTS